MKCEGCSLESSRADIFRTANRFLSPKADLCPACFHKAERKTDILVFWGYLILGILSLPFILWPPTHAIGFVLLSFSAIQLCFLISTIFHELGHAAAGRLAGIRIFGIEIGKGNIIYDFFIGGLHWRFRAIPFGGCAHGVPRTGEFFRSSEGVFVLGGPFANIMALAVSVYLLPLDQQLESTVFNGFEPVLFFALSNAVLLLYSLWPHTFDSVRGRIPNDALLFWRILQIKETQINENLSWRYLYEASECQWKKDLAGAEAWIRKGLQKFPKSAALNITAATILYLQKKYQEASRSYALLIGRQKGPESMDAFILNNLAYCYLLTGKPELLAKADTCSRLALKQAPSVPSHLGTRGSVLVELGRYDEGLKLLHEAMKKNPENFGQALNACYIGIAEARLGNPAESRNYFSIARRLDPDCILLNREQVLQ